MLRERQGIAFPPIEMTRIVRKHPWIIRFCHWSNFVCLITMMWSGMLIYWAHRPYRIGIGDWTLLPLFPDSFYEFFARFGPSRMDHRLAEGIAWHLAFLWPFLLTGLAYVVGLLCTQEWRNLVPNRKSLHDAVRTIKNDLRLRRHLRPEGKYNGAQRFAYTGVLVLGLVATASGFAIWKPVQLSWLTSALGGYQMARAIHFVCWLGFALFLFIHVVQVMRAGWATFFGMISGWERASREPAADSGETA